MRKIFLLLTVLVLGFVLISCSPDTSEIDFFLSPNKIVYTMEEFDGSKPKVALKDFEYYAIRQNQTATKEAIPLSEVTIVPSNKDNIYSVNVRGKSYLVYVYDELATNPDDVAVSALSPTFGVETDEEKARNVRELFFSVITNKVKLDNVNVVSATYGAISNDDVLVENAEEYLTVPPTYETDILKTYNVNILSFNLNDSDSTLVEIKNHTYKPQDNQLPISTEMENSTLGYIWDWVLIIPIAFIMQFFAGIFFNSFAVGIIFATIIVRTLAWPIYAKANNMSINMALAQPDLNKLQNKYALKKDPASQQKMQMEMMALYKKHGISFLGCLTPIMQMPLFLAMFQVVYRITVQGGMYSDKVSNPYLMFGLIDLTKGGFEDVWSYLLAAIVGGTMFLLQKISAKKPSYAKDTGTQVKTEQAEQSAKTMKTVSTVMIVMMVFTTISSVNALGFYWVIGNTYSLVQSIINRKLSEKKYYKQKEAQTII